MLYSIQNGYGVQQRQASEIVYLCFRHRVLVTHSLTWCFTDGHAKQELTEFYSSHDDVTIVDVKAIHERFWASRKVMETDPDIRRRKQAELLIHQHVPAKAILHILTASEEATDTAKQFVLNSGLAIEVSPAPYDRFYY